MPAGAFFRGLLFFYGLEVTHLKLNSIAQIAIFIHLCEAFLGIAPHFNLWFVVYHLRGRSYPALELRDSNKGWNKEWFMVSNPSPCLPARTGRAPEYRACWKELPIEEDMVQVTLLPNEIAGLSA